MMEQETDMIYNTVGGNTTAGGYSVESVLLKQGMPALYSANVGGGKEEKVSDRFKHLAVPAGLFYMHENVNNSTREINEKNDSNIINDDLYEKLLKLAEHDVKESNTKNNNKQTKKRANKVNKNKVIHKKTKRKYVKA